MDKLPSALEKNLDIISEDGNQNLSPPVKSPLKTP